MPRTCACPRQLPTRLSGGVRGAGGCRPRGGAWAMDSGRGERASRRTDKRDGRAPGERPAYRTTALQDTSNLTSVNGHTDRREGMREGEEPISW
jgi:hypothetical protein